MKILLDAVKKELAYLTVEYAEPFQSPGNLGVLEELQNYIDKELPSEFVDLYEYCDGATRECFGVFPYGLEFRPLELCLSAVKSNDESSNDDQTFELIGKRYTLEFVDKQIDSKAEFSKFRIPIATSTRMEICIDVAPSKYGCVGQVIFIDHEYRYGIFLEESLSKLFETFKSDLSNGLYSLDEQYPGQLISDKSIELANWYLSRRWAHVPKPEGWRN